MRWTQTAARRDESTLPELQWARKKDLRCTAHTTIRLKFQVISMLKKKKRKKGGQAVIILWQWKWNESQQAQNTKKVTWWLLPVFKPRSGSQTRLNWPWFHERAVFHRFELSIIEKPHTHHKSFHRDRGENMINCLSVQLSRSYALLYNWSLRSTESYHGHVIQHWDFDL